MIYFYIFLKNDFFFSFYSSWESRACTLAVNTVTHPLWNTLFPSTQKLTFKILWVFIFSTFFFIKSCHFILSSPSWWAWSLISNDHDDDHDKSLSQARSMIIDHDDHDKYPAQRVGTAHRSWHGFPRIVELLCQARAEQKWGETS